MKVRSTGLGKTEMKCNIHKVSIQESHLLVTLQSYEPVQWQIRTAMTYKDILTLLKVGLPQILLYLVVGVKTLFKTPPGPAEY